MLNIRKSETDEQEGVKYDSILYLDEEGNLVISGSVKVGCTQSQDESGNVSISDIVDNGRFDEKIDERATEILNGALGDYLTEDRINALIAEQIAADNNSKKQYMSFDSDEGLILGANIGQAAESPFKTVITNTKLSFKYDNTEVAYMMGEKLNIDNVVIDNVLQVGKFVLKPHSDDDGGMSIVWKK